MSCCATYYGRKKALLFRCNVGVATVTMMSNKTNDEGKVTEISEFHWSPETIGYVDASFFWGYIVTQLPGGFLGEQAASTLYKKVFGFPVPSRDVTYLGDGKTAYLCLQCSS